MNGYLYVIGPKNGPFKIGISKNVKRRFKELNQCSPISLEIKKVYKVKGEEKILESKCHNELKIYHIHGEWFKLHMDKVNKIILNNALNLGYGLIETKNFFIKKRKKNFQTDIVNRKAAAVEEKEKSARQVARELGVSTNSILRDRKEAGIEVTKKLSIVEIQNLAAEAYKDGVRGSDAFEKYIRNKKLKCASIDLREGWKAFWKHLRNTNCITNSFTNSFTNYQFDNYPIN